MWIMMNYLISKVFIGVDYQMPQSVYYGGLPDFL